MKILLFISSLGSGGAERQLVTLGCLLKKQGIDVEFLVYHDEPFYESLLTEKHIIIHKILSKNYIKRLFLIRKFIRRSNYKVVISFLETPNFINCFSALGGKKWKIITSERSSNKRFFLSKKGKLFAWFQRFSDHIVCNSDSSRKIWEEYYPYYNNKLSVIYNTVNLSPVTEDYIPKKENKTHIIIAASYQYLKNPIGVIEAICLMTDQEKSKFQINWYGRKEVTKGNTQAFEESKYLIKKNKLEDIIYLHGETKDIVNKIYQSDAVGLFSEYEGLPNTICEAMTLGKPIIMTKVSDYSILIDNNNGFLCDWRDPVTIKASLIKMSSLSKDELINMGENSYIKAKKLFSSDAVIEKWIDLLGLKEIKC